MFQMNSTCARQRGAFVKWSRTTPLSGRLTDVSLTKTQWQIPAQASPCSPLLCPCRRCCKPSAGTEWRTSSCSMGNAYNNICATDCASKCTNETGRVDGDSTTLIPLALCGGACATAAQRNPSSSITPPVLMTDDDNCRSSLRLFPMEHSYCSQKTDNGTTDARGSNQSGHHLKHLHKSVWLKPSRIFRATIHSKVWEHAMFTSLHDAGSWKVRCLLWFIKLYISYCI